MEDLIKIKRNDYNHPLKFSICTIVNNMDEYSLMQNSFKQSGFLNDCEYIIADNTKENEFDAYESISHFLKVARGEFIIVVHQDVRIKDDKNKLVKCLNELEEKDSTWAICGNAGGVSYHNTVIHISHISHTELTKNLPLKVKTLDENFLLIKSESNITISSDLKGFHLYGTDLCIIANFLGYSAYVIEFLVLHLSKGNIADLKKHEGNFIKKYGSKNDIGYVQTNCTQFYLSNSIFKNKLLNSSFFFFFIKQVKRYPYLLKRKKKNREIIQNE